MRARLLGLVLIPSVGLAVVAAHEVRDHRRLADEARQLAVDVDDAAVALDAFVATTQEYRLVEIVAQAEGFGVPVSVAGDMLGLDLEAELAAVGKRLAANPLLPTLLERADGSDDLDHAAPDDPVFASLVVEAERAWIAEHARMFEGRNAAAIEDDLRDNLHALRSSAELFQIANDQLLLVSETVVPGSTWRPAEILDFDVLAARYDVTLERAATEADAHVRPALQLLLDDQRFAQVLDEFQLSSGQVVGVEDLGTLFEPGIDRDRHLQRLTETTARDARTHTLAVGDAAQASYRRTFWAVLGLLAATIVLALLVARSIARPLLRLARRAAEVSDGELDGSPLRVAGPRETAVLARTINDAVDNLRAVEGQMAALAAGDLTAARAAIPGKLGELVGRSVDGLARSMAERDQLQRRLAHEASHDALTGLANRRTAVATLDELLGSGARLALLFLDLDGFKLVNDEQGHAVGDALLTMTADRLTEAAPTDALVARLGGDEFIVAAEVGSEADASLLARHLADLLYEQITIEGLPHRVAVSVGVAIAQEGDDADLLLRSADAALYEAKRAGRGSVVVLDDVLRASLDAEHQVEADLRHALAAGQLELHYQPVFESSGAMHGVEALVRWRRTDGTLTPPDDFIPTAERTGLIVELDRWVLEEGLAQIGEWRRGPFPGLRLSVNASASTLLSTYFVHDVAGCLHRAGLGGEALIIEVTETALLHDLDTAAEHITQLAALGVATSVDDFGTGYTSVSHLRRLPIQEVKIDRSFIQAMGDDDRDRVLVDLIVRIGSVLTLDVVAEGIETQEQLDTVRSLGCRFAQGYHLGRPVTAAELLANHQVTPANR